MSDFYTEDLSKFGYREVSMLKDLLTAWIDGKGLPEHFEYNNVRPAFNMNSGNVFLVNDDYQVAMLNGDDLELFHILPYSGEEGFITDLIQLDADSLNSDDVEYIQSYYPSYGKEAA